MLRKAGGALTMLSSAVLPLQERLFNAGSLQEQHLGPNIAGVGCSWDSEVLTPPPSPVLPFQEKH